MSFFGMGGGRPQPSSAERIAAAEAEIELVSDMFNRYVSPKLMIAACCPLPTSHSQPLSTPLALQSQVQRCTKELTRSISSQKQS